MENARKMCWINVLDFRSPGPDGHRPVYLTVLVLAYCLCSCRWNIYQHQLLQMLQMITAHWTLAPLEWYQLWKYWLFFQFSASPAVTSFPSQYYRFAVNIWPTDLHSPGFGLHSIGLSSFSMDALQATAISNDQSSSSSATVPGPVRLQPVMLHFKKNWYNQCCMRTC